MAKVADWYPRGWHTSMKLYEWKDREAGQCINSVAVRLQWIDNSTKRKSGKNASVTFFAINPSNAGVLIGIRKSIKKEEMCLRAYYAIHELAHMAIMLEKRMGWHKDLEEMCAEITGIVGVELLKTLGVIDD